MVVDVNLDTILLHRVRTTVPYKKEIDAPTTRTTSFENPGYDTAAVAGFGAPSFGAPDSVLYEDIPPIVPSPYQEMNDFGAAINPLYRSTGLENVPSTDGHRSRKFDADNADFSRKPGIPKAPDGNKTLEEQDSKMSFDAGIRQQPTVLILNNSDRPDNFSEI